MAGVLRGLMRWGVCGVLLAALAGCGAFGDRISDANLKYADRAQIQRWRDEGEARLVFLDVRTRPAFRRGHLPGARHAPLATLRRNDPRLTGEATRLIVYGQSARDSLAPAAAKKLLGYGYADVFVLRGGIERWGEAGGAVERGASGGDR